MSYPTAKIIKQYLDGASKRELIRVYQIGPDTLGEILNGAKRDALVNIKKNPIPKQIGLYADRDTNLLNYYAALRPESQA